MTTNPELLDYALRIARREKLPPEPPRPPRHWTTLNDWNIPRIKLDPPERPKIEFMDEDAR